MNFKSIRLLPMVILLTACASGHRETSTKIRNLVMANKHDEAILALNESPLAKDQKSKLLYLIELGLLEHYKGNFPQSIKILTDATVIIDDLYTTKASGKVTSVLSNDNSDFFYGEKYEASLVYFYLSLNHYMQADAEVDPAKKKVALLGARSEILA